MSALTGQPGQGAGEATHTAAAAPAAALISAGREAFGALDASLRPVLHGDRDSLLAQVAGASAQPAGDPLTSEEAISNAAVLMFGGIETTEGMITNALWHLLSNPGQLQLIRHDASLVPNAIEESLRLEPAAAFVDRYATRDVHFGGAAVRRGDLVTVSLSGAGRDPATFARPDSYDVRRANARLHLAFAVGPHFCLGAHLARLEAQSAVQCVLRMLPGVRLDPGHQAAPRGLVFRKPPALHVRWDAPAA